MLGFGFVVAGRVIDASSDSMRSALIAWWAVMGTVIGVTMIGMECGRSGCLIRWVLRNDLLDGISDVVHSEGVRDTITMPLCHHEGLEVVLDPQNVHFG